MVALEGQIPRAVSAYLSGRLTPSQLASQCLRRADPKLNAFITLTAETAGAAAAASTQRYAQRRPLSPLDGVPVALKDNFCTRGIRTTCGAKMLAKFVPNYDASVFSRLAGDGGAVLVGKCNMDQFAMGAGSVDSVWGPVRNPWDERRIAGGSSGGCAVAVATGACLAAIGSDTGGSTRNPASYCGLVGLKPTYGRVPRHGLIPLVNSMDVPGVLAQTVDDCAAVLDVVSGRDARDATTIASRQRFPRIRLPAAGQISVRGVRVGIPAEYHATGLADEVRGAWNELANALRDAGAVVHQVSMPHTELSIACYTVLNQCEVSSNMARYDGLRYGHRSQNENAVSAEALYTASRSEGLNEVVRNRILAGNYFLLRKNYDKYFNQALKVRRLIAGDFDAVWEKGFDFLLTPTTLTAAPLYEDFILATNRDQCAVQDFCTQPANMAGIPAVSIPIKLSSDGLPISLQLMGRNFSEARLLALAKFVEGLVQFPHNDHLSGHC